MFDDTSSGDRVVIEKLRLPARIGVYPREKERRQTLCLSLEFGLPSRRCFRTDAIGDTIDYAAVAEALRRLAVSRHFNLVEYFAEQAARVVLNDFGALWVGIRVSKIGVVPGSESVGVAITRHRVMALDLDGLASGSVRVRRSDPSTAAVADSIAGGGGHGAGAGDRGERP